MAPVNAPLTALPPSTVDISNRVWGLSKTTDNFFSVQAAPASSTYRLSEFSDSESLYTADPQALCELVEGPDPEAPCELTEGPDPETPYEPLEGPDPEALYEPLERPDPEALYELYERFGGAASSS